MKIILIVDIESYLVIKIRLIDKRYKYKVSKKLSNANLTNVKHFLSKNNHLIYIVIFGIIYKTYIKCLILKIGKCILF